MFDWFGGKKKKEEHKELPKETPDIESMALNSGNIRTVLGKNQDIMIREVILNEQGLAVTLVFIDGLVNSTHISDYILKPLFQNPKLQASRTTAEVIQLLKRGVLYYSSQKIIKDFNQVVQQIIQGNAALIFDNEQIAFTFETFGFEKRSVEEPTGENVFKGSKDCFVETLRTNTATVRRKLKTHKLVVKETIVGKQSITNIALIYIEGIVNMHLVDEVQRRLDSINIDSVSSVGFIEEFIVDHKYTPFPQVVTTERPDKFCANIVEGRIGLIIDGFPIAYIVPGTMIQFIQAPEDYSQNYIISSLVSTMRVIAVLTTLFIPGFYVAVTTFHQEMIPTELALSITATKEGVPHTSFFEVFMLLLAFEVLVEAGFRMPKAIGQAVSIVGALIVGEAAVNAQFVSPAAVVIIAITAISSFVLPNQDFSNAIRLWRFIIVILSSLLGLYGLSLGSILLLYGLANMEVFGVPYLSPLVGNDYKQMQDTFARFPVWTFKNRPLSLRTKNKRRQG